MRIALFRRFQPSVRLLSHLSRRERWIVGGGVLFLVFLFGYLFILSPMLAQTERLNALIPRKEQELVELSGLASEYASLSARLASVSSRIRPAEAFSILSYVEETAGRRQVRENIAYIRPLSPQVHQSLREVPVEVKVENVTLGKLVGFVAAIEQAPALLRIRRLTVKTRFADPAFLDATFVVSAYERAGDGRG